MGSHKQSWKNSMTQVAASLLACSLSFQLGACMAFATIMLPPEILVETINFENSTADVEKVEYVIHGNNTTEELRFDKEQASWVASLVALTSTISAALSGVLMDRLGRKAACQTATAFFLVGWLLTASVSTDITVLYIGRAISGMGQGLSVTGVIYTAEVTHASIRTSMLALTSVLTSLGIFLTTILGYYVSWRCVAIFSAGLIFVPESPRWLSANIEDEEQRRSKIEKSLAWLYKDPRIYDEEINNYDGIQKRTQEAIFYRPSTVAETKISNRGKLLKSLFLLCGLFFFQEVTGGFAILHYALQLFQVTGSIEVDGWTFLFLLGIIRVAMAVASAFQYFGRRSLLLASTFGMTITILAASLWLHSSTPSLGPVILVLLYVTFSAFGVLPVPFTLTGELLPNEYRGRFSGFIFCFNYVLMFIVVKVSIIVLDAIGIANLYLVFGLFSAAMFFFVYFFIPETLGRTLDEIQKSLQGW